MTSYSMQNWNGSAWMNSWQSTAAYDADNFTISQSFKAGMKLALAWNRVTAPIIFIIR